MQYVTFNAKVHWEMTGTHEGRQILPGGPDNASEQWQKYFHPSVTCNSLQKITFLGLIIKLLGLENS